MIYVLFGDDEFTLSGELAAMKAEVGPADLLDVNITVLDGPSVSFDEVVATSSTVPFLADKRMVIVQGLLSQFEVRAPSRQRGRSATVSKRSLGQWEKLPEHLAQLPGTTELVFVDGRLIESNSLFGMIRPLAQVRRYPLPTGSKLREWIRQRAADQGADIEPAAIDALIDSVGGNMRVLDLELQKLSVYRGAQSIRREHVLELVAYARETNIFAAVDAVVEARPGAAIQLIQQLLASGGSATYIITMIARQVRLLLLAKDLKAQGVSPAQMGPRLSLSGYPLRKTLEQEGRFTLEQLAGIHRELLEADLNVKTGGADDQVTLEVLVAELASRPRSS